ncbi:MAG: transketolase family protein [Lachnospiraceae bacterium]|nr:transketolase family protein [Lachnospiraceae bacterium]
MKYEEKMMRAVYTDLLIEAANHDDRIVVLEADLKGASGTQPFFEAHPDKAYNIGISEGALIAGGAGMAAMGKVVFADTFAAFITRRAHDHIMLSVAYAQNKNMKIVGTDPGITAELNGGTHMPFEDVAIMRVIPTMTIFEPCDAWELKKAFPQILAHEDPIYIRLNRRNPLIVHDENYEFELGKADLIKEGKDVTLIASGILVEQAILAAEELAKEGIDAEVINIHTIKPLDCEAVVASAAKTRAVVTAENANVIGGLGGAVAECLAEKCPTVMRRIGAQDRFGQVGHQDFLLEEYNMTAADIVKAAKEAIAAK